MRTFVGIGLPPEVRRSIAEAILPLRSSRPPVSWTPEPNLHVTLMFLGEIPAERAAAAGERLLEAGRGVPPFDLAVSGGGCFPPSGSPRVLWVGIREPLDFLIKLHHNVRNMLRAAGFPGDEKPFHPHITVGRARGALPRGWREGYTAALAGKSFGHVPVRSFQLYESRLSPAGAAYSVLRDVPLKTEIT